MKRIHKYSFSIEPPTTVVLRVGAEVLRASVQNGNPTMWALIDPAAAPETWTFDVYATGDDIDDLVDSVSYVDTIFLPNGEVYHVFVA